MLKIKKWLNSKKLWLKGGMIGALACISLFVLELFVYFPIISRYYKGSLPNGALILPTITGHIFALLSGFWVPYGFLCKFTEPICTSWSATSGPGSVPWTLETGEIGFCIEQTMTPTNACANLSELVGFFGPFLLLLAVYFAVGAIIGKVVERRRKH